MANKRQAKSLISQLIKMLKTKRQLLFVDDDLAEHELIRSGLHGLSFDIDTTEDPEIALQMLDDKKYDLVLLDFNMDGMNGLEFVKAMKRPLQQVTLYTGVELPPNIQTEFDKLGVPVLTKDISWMKLGQALMEGSE